MKRESINVSREVVYSSSVQVLLLLFAFGTLVLLSRKLGPSAFGVYAVLLAVGKVIKTIPGGFSEGIKKRVSENGAAVEELYTAGILGHACFVLVTVPIIISLGFGSQLLSFWNSIAIACFITTSGLFEIFTSYVSGLGHPSVAYKYRLLRNVLLFSIQVPLAYSGASVNELVIGASIAWGLSALTLGFRWSYPLELPTRQTLASVGNFSKYSIPNKLLFTGDERLPYFVLGILGTSTLVGYYEVAWRIIVPALFVSYVIDGVLSVHISHQIDAGKTIREEVSTGLAISTVLTLPMLIGSVLLGEELVRIIYSESYAVAGDLLPLVSAVICIKSFLLVYQSVFRGRDSPRLIAVIGVSRLVGKLLALPLGFIFFGLPGVVASILLLDVIALIAYYSVEQVFAEKRILGSQIFGSLVMACVVSIGKHYLGKTPVEIIGLVVVGGIVYAVVWCGLVTSVASTQLESIYNRDRV